MMKVYVMFFCDILNYVRLFIYTENVDCFALQLIVDVQVKR